MLFDQLDFPAPFPFLPEFFLVDRGIHIFKNFEINKHLHAILFRESLGHAFAMLPNAA